MSAENEADPVKSRKKILYSLAILGDFQRNQINIYYKYRDPNHPPQLAFDIAVLQALTIPIIEINQDEEDPQAVIDVIMNSPERLDDICTAMLYIDHIGAAEILTYNKSALILTLTEGYKVWRNLAEPDPDLFKSIVGKYLVCLMRDGLHKIEFEEDVYELYETECSLQETIVLALDQIEDDSLWRSYEGVLKYSDWKLNEILSVPGLPDRKRQNSATFLQLYITNKYLDHYQELLKGVAANKSSKIKKLITGMFENYQVLGHNLHENNRSNQVKRMFEKLESKFNALLNLSS